MRTAKHRAGLSAAPAPAGPFALIHIKDGDSTAIAEVARFMSEREAHDALRKKEASGHWVGFVVKEVDGVRSLSLGSTSAKKIEGHTWTDVTYACCAANDIYVAAEEAAERRDGRDGRDGEAAAKEAAERQDGEDGSDGKAAAEEADERRDGDGSDGKDEKGDKQVAGNYAHRYDYDHGDEDEHDSTDGTVYVPPATPPPVERKKGYGKGCVRGGSLHGLWCLQTDGLWLYVDTDTGLSRTAESPADEIREGQERHKRGGSWEAVDLDGVDSGALWLLLSVGVGLLTCGCCIFAAVRVQHSSATRPAVLLGCGSGAASLYHIHVNRPAPCGVVQGEKVGPPLSYDEEAAVSLASAPPPY